MNFKYVRFAFYFLAAVKKNKQKYIIFSTILLLIIGIFYSSKQDSAKAKGDALGMCQVIYTDGTTGLEVPMEVGEMHEEECTMSNPKVKEEADYYKTGTIHWIDSTKPMGQRTVVTQKEPEVSCGVDPSTWIPCILRAILRLMGILIIMAATIFNWVLDPVNMKYIMQGGSTESVYAIWAMVRDTLNIAFILVLIFSAFATVFQVDKYSYKNVLLRLVLMALLVNFSYPLTRFIIDFANSMMYFLLNGMGLTPGSTFADISKNSSLDQILNAPTSDIAYLIASIIFLWIYGITLLIIAGLFVIRTVALTLLIIFSAVAFTGTIIPFTSSYASKWWDNLFKYAFFGPVMVFMIAVSAKMLVSLQGIQSTMEHAANGQTAIASSFIASISLLIIPIIILWGGIIFAQSMSLAGGSTVINGAKKFGNKKWFGARPIFNATGVPGGFKKAKDHYAKKGAPGLLGKVPGLRGSEARELSEDRIAGFLTKGNKGRKNAQIEYERKQAADMRKKWKDNGGATDKDVRNALNSKNNALRKAAALEMAEKNGFGDGKDKKKDFALYKTAMIAIEDDPVYKKVFNDKVKEKHIRLVIDNEIEKDKREGTGKGEALIYKEQLNKMNAEQLSKQNNLFDRNEFYQYFMDQKYANDDKFVIETAKRINAKTRSDWKARRGYKI